MLPPARVRRRMAHTMPHFDSKRLLATTIIAMIALTTQASAFVLTSGERICVALDGREPTVVFTALNMVRDDLRRVMGVTAQVREADARIIVGTHKGAGERLLGATGLDFSSLAGQSQAFQIAVDREGRLVVAGSDGYGTAYGLVELTRMLGVSPWEWWADVDVQPRDTLSLPDGYTCRQAPDVAYRGIFINDEDWGLLPWSTFTYEPNDKHAIGPQTTQRIFELMLRLRLNLYWPPMHEHTRPFFLTQGCRELASRYGISIGTSHCEPMASNAAGEWSQRGKGDYNFIKNRKHVLDFWQERVRQVARQPIVYTLGMRGLHDGMMQGVKSVADQRKALTRIIEAQRKILSEQLKRPLYSIPQVFIPYKEVQEAYDDGLEVPDDVTLLWCDDNYGYIRHFPTEAERKRLGGNGVYYHISYWGRPHDYLWLGTASPYLMYQQLYEAYYHGANRMWVLNVGDIKPSEYQVQLYADMGWSIEGVRQQTIGQHLEQFFATNVAPDVARLLAIYMKEHYQLSFQMKPEHLAGTRVEEPRGGDVDWSAVRDLPWSEHKIRHRLGRYDLMRRNILWVADSVRRTHPERYEAFYELAEYPLRAAIAQNNKYLLAQLARHRIAWLSGETVEQTWQRSDLAHNEIQQLTQDYNALRGGKWNGIMNSNPRGLTVFQPVPHTTVDAPLPEEPASVAHFYGASYSASSFTGSKLLDPLLGLGTSIRAMPLPKGCDLTYSFDHNFGRQKQVQIELRLLPTHPVEEQQRLTLSFDGGDPMVVTYATQGRSEEWKQNVTRNYALVTLTLPVAEAAGRHSVRLKALDDGVVVDELYIRK